MAKISVYDMTGAVVSDLELNDNIFGIEPNTVVMHAAVVNYLANQRQGTQSTLTRTEVSGGGKKPWRQKGTGHARQGSTRAGIKKRSKNSLNSLLSLFCIFLPSSFQQKYNFFMDRAIQ